MKLLLSCTSLFFGALAKPTVDPFVLPATPNVWADFEPVLGTTCMDGRESGVWLRKGRDPTKLLMYLQGGGNCFNFLTCATVETNPRGIDPDPGIRGILDFDNERNPLRDYSVVWVAYCSGDMMLGNTGGEVPVPGSGSRRFNGRSNFGLVMDRMRISFPGIDEMVIAGQSAGGVSALVNFDYIATEMSATNDELHFLMIDDSAPLLGDAYFAPCLAAQWRDLWSTESAYPPGCTACINPDGSGLFNLHEYMQTKWGHRATFGIISSAQDNVMRLFFGYGNDECNPGPLPSLQNFEEGLRDAQQFWGPNWATFLFPGASHTYLTKDDYYTVEFEDFTLSKWLKALLDGEFLKINPWGDVWDSQQQAYIINRTHTITPMANATF